MSYLSVGSLQPFASAYGTGTGGAISNVWYPGNGSSLGTGTLVLSDAPAQRVLAPSMHANVVGLPTNPTRTNSWSALPKEDSGITVGGVTTIQGAQRNIALASPTKEQAEDPSDLSVRTSGSRSSGSAALKWTLRIYAAFLISLTAFAVALETNRKWGRHVFERDGTPENAAMRRKLFNDQVAWNLDARNVGSYKQLVKPLSGGAPEITTLRPPFTEHAEADIDEASAPHDDEAGTEPRSRTETKIASREKPHFTEVRLIPGTDQDRTKVLVIDHAPVMKGIGPVHHIVNIGRGPQFFGEELEKQRARLAEVIKHAGFTAEDVQELLSGRAQARDPYFRKHGVFSGCAQYVAAHAVKPSAIRANKAGWNSDIPAGYLEKPAHTWDQVCDFSLGYPYALSHEKRQQTLGRVLGRFRLYGKGVLFTARSPEIEGSKGSRSVFGTYPLQAGIAVIIAALALPAFLTHQATKNTPTSN